MTFAHMSTPPDVPHRFARNTVILLVSQVVLRVTGVISAVLLANYLDVTLYGQYNFALALAGLFIPLCDFGIDALLVREIASGRIERGSATGTSLTLKLVFVSVTLALLVALNYGFFAGEADPYMLSLAAAVIVLRTTSGTFVAFFRADQRMGLDSRVQMFGKAAELGAILGAVYFGATLIEIFYLLLAGATLNTFYTWQLSSRRGYMKGLAFSWAVGKGLLRDGLPFVLTGVSVVLYFQINTVMLSTMVGDEETGIYRAAANLMFAISAFSAAIVTALFPVIAREHERNKEVALKAARQATFYSLLFSLPIAFGTMVIADDLMSAVFKSSFANSAVVLMILIWWIPISYVTNILGNILSAIGFQRSVLAVAVVNAIFNIGVNAVLIPSFQSRGAAIATVVTELLGLAVLLVFVRRRFGNVIDWGTTGRQVLACVLMIIPLAIFGQHVHVFVTISIGAVLYVVVVFLLRVVSTSDVRTLLRILRPHSGDSAVETV